MSTEQYKKNKEEVRITELNEKFTQILLFLSFGVVGVATLTNIPKTSIRLPSESLGVTLQYWELAFFPTLLGIVPIKELFKKEYFWIVILFKILSLLVALWLIAVGVLYLLKAPCAYFYIVNVVSAILFIWQLVAVIRSQVSKKI